MTGGFSRAIHILETNKGWTTEYVLGLPLCRIRQLLELIIQDKREDLKFQAQLVEWQTRNVCAMFTVAAREAKQAREINKAVNKMRLPLGDEESEVNDDRSYGDIVEQGAKVDLNDQPAFEALDALFQTI